MVPWEWRAHVSGLPHTSLPAPFAQDVPIDPLSTQFTEESDQKCHHSLLYHFQHGRQNVCSQHWARGSLSVFFVSLNTEDADLETGQGLSWVLA